MNHLEGFSNIFLRAGGQSFHKEESITFLVNVNDAGGWFDVKLIGHGLPTCLPDITTCDQISQAFSLIMQAIKD